MALNLTQQINNLIEDAKHILVVFAEHAKGDHIASASALVSFLERKGKQVEAVSHNFSLPKKFVFLQSSEQIQATVPHLQKFKITIDVKESGIQELSYDVQDEQLHIFVTPKSGFFTNKHLKTAQSEFRYDLIITLGTQDFESLGSLYQKNSELFHEVPLINIDHAMANERYGEVNLVDSTACATAEVLAKLLQDLEQTSITESIATALLAGMISATNSFKSENTHPHSLAMASKLVDMGANRQEVITQLYQTKSLATLRLWGQALAHLNYDKTLGLVSSTITRDDFVRAGAKESDLYDIIDELIATSPDEKMTLLLHEHEEEGTMKIHCILYTEKEYDSKYLAAGFNPQGDEKQVQFTFSNKSLREAETLVIEEIRRKSEK